MSALLNGGVLNAAGGEIKANNGTGAPDHFQNGLPFESDGKLAVDFTAVADHYHQGIAFSANGRIAAKSGAAQYYGSGAAPFLPVAILSIVDDVADHYSSGVAYGTGNQVCISTE